jgi:hypothetical protein
LISETAEKKTGENERTREFEYLIRESAEKYVRERREFVGSKRELQGEGDSKKVRNRRGREKFARLFHNSRDRSK